MRARAPASLVSDTGRPAAAAAWNSASLPWVRLSSWDLVASSWAFEASSCALVSFSVCYVWESWL